MFEKEAKGLEILRGAGALEVPETVLFGENDDTAFLVLKRIKSAPKKPEFWEDFGRKLAELHRNENNKFGLDHDNYIGSLVQINGFCDTWSEFFITKRLEVQIRTARNSGMLSGWIIKAFDSFFNKVEEIFPEENPALIHGDLWGGNFMVNSDGEPVIIDPAVYYGHREMDLGMSKLFGGFDNRFYEAYNSAFPLEKGWEKRLDYCNLYPLMVHVNLFGGGYLGSVETVLRKFRK
jgi:fructosamine-3-kinase